MSERKDDRNLLTGIVSFLVQRVGTKRSFVLPADVAKSSKVLVVDSGDLTDLLFIAPVIKQLQERYPDKRTTILVNSSDAPVVKEIMRSRCS